MKVSAFAPSVSVNVSVSVSVVTSVVTSVEVSSVPSSVVTISSVLTDSPLVPVSVLDSDSTTLSSVELSLLPPEVFPPVLEPSST